MEYDLEIGHRGGGDERQALDINSSGGGDRGDGGRTARRTNRRSGGGGAGGGRRARHINRWREQRWMVTLAIHTVFLAFNGLLYMLIQIKYQNLNNSPFETHMVMISSLVALCVYSCTATLQTILVQTNNELDDPRLLNHVLVCSGILLLLSNMLVFLPNTVGWIVVVLFVFATIVLLVYDVFKLISNCIYKRNNNNNNATPTSESVGLEMSTGINHNAATTSESLDISIENNNETSRNNSDAVEMRIGNNFTGSTHTPFHSFQNQGFGD